MPVMREPRRIPPNRRKSPLPLATVSQRESWYPRIGDWLAKLLANIPWVRMTPKRWRQIKVAWGFADACNCSERKIALNKFGRWIVKPFRRAAANARAIRQRLSAAIRRCLAGRDQSHR